MPIYLEARDITADLEGFKSVLIVSCPICPPMCVSMQRQKPFIDFFKKGLKSEAFEDYIAAIRQELSERGIRTGVFTMRLPVPMMCLWTKGQRDRLLKRARNYDAVLVLGCDSATFTAADTLRHTECQTFQAMRVKTITNAVTNIRFPAKVELDWHPMPSTPTFAGRRESAEKERDSHSSAP